MKLSEIKLTDQVAVVIGGVMGRAIALAFAQAGADVAAADIIPERCEETAARISEFGRKALPVAIDVMESDTIRARRTEVRQHAMAAELAEHGIRVNGISPDHTISPGTRGNRTGAVDPSTAAARGPEVGGARPPRKVDAR